MELSATTLVFLSLLSLPILVTLLSRKPRPRSKNRQPPGPWNLPLLIGSLHHFIKTNPQVALRNLANKYGPVMFLRMGQIDTIVISSTAAAQEVLREKDLTFASRPSIVASEICYGNTDITFSPYGAYWRTLRKLCTVELLSAKMVRRLAPVRNDETLSLIRSVQAAGQGGKPVNLGSLLLSCSNIMAAKAAFGHVWSSELREQFLSGLHVGLQFTSGFTIGDVFPSLRFVEDISGRRRRMLRAHRQLDDVLDKIIAQCEALQGVGSMARRRGLNMGLRFNF